MNANRTRTVLLADPMDGVRAAWRWLLTGASGWHVVGEVTSIAEAVAASGDVVLSGLRFADGSAADLIARAGRPVVVWTFLPADERSDVDLSGAAAVLEAGQLRAGLAAALESVSAGSGW